MRNRIAAAVGLLVGLLAVWGAVGVWIGIAQAETGQRIPGSVSAVQCGTRSACSGDFTASDGSIRSRRVVVTGTGAREAPQPAVLVPAIANGLTGAIQSRDTAYVGPVTLNVVGDLVVAVLLSLLGLALTLPYLLIAALWLGRRR